MKYVVIILSVLLAVTIYMWATKPTVVINGDAEKIELLKQKNYSLETLLTDTIRKQEEYYLEKLRYSDSVAKAKRINNWNLIQQHEKELAKYQDITNDSAFINWCILSRTATY